MESSWWTGTGRSPPPTGGSSELWHVPPELVDTREWEQVFEHVRAQVQHPEQFTARLLELYADPEKEGVDTMELRDGRILERYSRPQRLGDTIVGRVWSYRDVTAERRAQAERERLLREAQEAIRVRDDFLSIASHELKTPLTPLKLHLQVLKQRVAPGRPVSSPHVEKALAQVTRLSGLINDLLDTSRIQAGRLELKHEPVSLRELTREVLADLRPVSTDHTLEYEESDEALVIEGDRGRLGAGAGEPAGERPQVQPHGREHPRPGGEGRDTGPHLGVGLGDWNSTGPEGPPLRALLPRPQRPHLGLRRAGPRALHLPGHRRAPRRPHLGGERGGPRLHLPIHPPGGGAP